MQRAGYNERGKGRRRGTPEAPLSWEEQRQLRLQQEEAEEHGRGIVARTRAERLKAEADATGAQAEVFQRENEILDAEIEQRGLQRERDIQEFMDLHGVGRPVAEASLGYRRVPLTPAGAAQGGGSAESAPPRNSVDEFSSMWERVKGMEAQIKDQIAQESGAPPETPGTLMSRTVADFLAVKGAMIDMAQSMGFLSPDDVKRVVEEHRAAQPAPAATVLLHVDGIGDVPPDVFIEVRRLDKDFELKKHEAALRAGSDQYKWKVLDGFRSFMDKNLDMKALGGFVAQAISASKPEESVAGMRPRMLPNAQRPALDEPDRGSDVVDPEGGLGQAGPDAGLLAFDCPYCETSEAVLATAAQVAAGTEVACTECGKVTLLRAKAPETPAASAAPSNGNGTHPPAAQAPESRAAWRRRDANGERPPFSNNGFISYQ